MKASIFLCTVVLLLASACLDGDSINSDIRGIWAQEEVSEQMNRVSRLEYNFKPDNTVEVLRIELDLSSRAVLGYRSRRIGEYRISGNKLSFLNLVSYINDDSKGEYSDIADLVIVPETIGYDVTFEIRDNNELTLTYPPCGPLANCIGSQTFGR